MKKLISAIILLLIIFMLEFNWLEGILPSIYIWIELIIAIALMFFIAQWNDLVNKVKKMK